MRVTAEEGSKARARRGRRTLRRLRPAISPDLRDVVSASAPTSSSAESNVTSSRRRSRKASRSGCAVEIALEVDQVGLDQQLAVALEGRAHADADGGRYLAAVDPRDRRVDAGLPGSPSPGAGAMLAVGMSSSRPRASPGTTSPSSGEGAPSSSAAAATSPAATSSPDAAGGDRRAVRARPAARPRSRTRRASAAASTSPRAPWPKRKFAPTLDVAGAQHADEHLRAEVLGCHLRELLREGDREQLVGSQPGDDRRPSRRWSVSSCGGSSGCRTRSGCGSKVTTHRPQPVLACRASTAVADHAPVAEMHAVERAERDRAPFPGGRDLRERSEDIHRRMEAKWFWAERSATPQD